MAEPASRHENRSKRRWWVPTPPAAVYREKRLVMETDFVISVGWQREGCRLDVPSPRRR